MEKILFLDIDGVLNSHLFDMKRENHPDLGFVSNLDPEAIKTMNNLFDTILDLKIVISSDRRYEMDINQLIFYLENAGLTKNKIIDICDENIKKEFAIEKWIDENNPKNYCVIDDEWLFPIHHFIQPNFVRINGYEGIKNKHLELIINILEKS